MFVNGSLESIQKSVLSSEASLEAYSQNVFAGADDYSYNPIQQTQQKPETKPRIKPYGLPDYNGQGFELAYRNEGFKDNSEYSGNRINSVGTILNDDSTPIMNQTDNEDSSDYYGNSSTIPCRDQSLTFLSELKTRLPEYEPRKMQSSFLPPPPDTPPQLKPTKKNSNNTNSSNFKPNNSPPKYAVPELRKPTGYVAEPFDVKRPDSYYKATRGIRDSTALHRPRTVYEAAEEPSTSSTTSQPKKSYSRSKSEALLETNFDDDTGGGSGVGGINGNPNGLPDSAPLSPASRSYSQPLETAM